MSAPAALRPTAPAEEHDTFECAEEGAWPREDLRLVEPPAAAGARGNALPPAAPSVPKAHPWAASFAGQLAWNVVSEVAARGASLWLSFWCARALSVSTFGRFTFALALTQYLWLIGDATANGGFAAREIARLRVEHPGRASRLAGRFLSLRFGAGVAIAALVACAALVLPLDSDTRGALIGATTFLLAYGAFADWGLRAFEDFRGLAFASLAAAATLVVTTMAWLPAHPQASLAAALWGASFAVAALIAFVRLASSGRVRFAPPHPADARHWRRSAVFSLGSVAGIGIVQAPLLAMGLLGEAHANGLFGASYRLVVAVLGVFSVLWWPLFPVLSRSRPGSGEFSDALAALARTAMLLALPATILLLVWPSQVLTLAFGERYSGGATALRIAAAGIPVYAWSGLLEQACLATGLEALRARTYGIAAVLVTVAACATVPRFGAAAAAALMLGTFVFTSAVFLAAMHGQLPLAHMRRSLRPAFVLGGALALVWGGCAALHAPFLPSLAVGSIAYAAAVLGRGDLHLSRRTKGVRP
ncbi:MAG: hypothetical protein HZA61_10975 [Candidatus Eisenbacteria bacterium]|uniref:Uncharacterized protein n=1 Tax=Eiseniibacteriota bacterium TaxID=2212470 RepID=A0A933SD97_UNCEI|nr:hypothetical protein [Candidatus Eisenbacteria bacterium]